MFRAPNAIVARFIGQCIFNPAISNSFSFPRQFVELPNFQCLSAAKQIGPLEPRTSLVLMTKYTALGYDEWVIFNIKNVRGSHSIKVKNVSLSYGKLYTEFERDLEIPASQVEGTVIKPGAHYRIYSCGRGYSPSGTTGSFNLVDSTTGVLICIINWDCPWAFHEENTVSVYHHNSSWTVFKNGFKYRSTEIGEGELICAYNGN